MNKEVEEEEGEGEEDEEEDEEEVEEGAEGKEEGAEEKEEGAEEKEEGVEEKEGAEEEEEEEEGAKEKEGAEEEEEEEEEEEVVAEVEIFKQVPMVTRCRPCGVERIGSHSPGALGLSWGTESTAPRRNSPRPHTASPYPTMLSLSSRFLFV
ncbi:unnamed protein product [Xylocopa violacea]|uniref:Uncharacterized protein n=1 Tax=Xylocopa violacea TaxID=135666 RepID=A0ABP1P3A2_XYLVO